MCHNFLNSLNVYNVTPKSSNFAIPLVFSHMKNMLKDKVLKTSRLPFRNWLSRPVKYSGLSRNSL